MKAIVGYIYSRNSDEKTPIYEDVSEEEYEEGCEWLEREYFNLLRDYVFDRLKEKDNATYGEHCQADVKRKTS